ncbi:AAA family ATPase [Blautia sp. HCP3S3_H10_1]|uniref:AAA family ATPase n=1 Tax=unclassified Blautia TaxID=2648079 RepID=UPI003F8FA347
MIERIEIYWGADKDFEKATASLEEVNYLVDVLNRINETDVNIRGIAASQSQPMEVENLLIYTDDYGSVKEWVILGFSNNILKNLKINIKNLWLCNPPLKIYQDIVKNFEKEIIKEHKTVYSRITVEDMRKIAEGFNDVVIGQPHVMEQSLASIYALRNSNRKRPVTLLFLGDSGIGKTETAKYISSCLGTDMVRIQFSMQQTNSAYQYIFGAEHGEDSLARELIRRKSNIILLDEFDKVSPAFYNAFYQMFDEGVFVDANYSVDVSRCIIICTTNYRTEEEAEKYLGTPIYSRFSKIVVFNPISVNDKLRIAKKCYIEVMKQIEDDDQELIKNNSILEIFEKSIKEGVYPNMRMLRNDIEDAINYEILKARGII